MNRTQLLLLAGLMLVLQLFHEQLFALLRFEPEAILSGEWWRLFSAHWVHASWRHMLLNLASMLLGLWLFPCLSWPRQLWPTLVLCSLSVSLGQWLLHPQLHWGAGFSGVFYGLLAAGCVLRWGRGWLPVVVTLLLVMKVAWEQLLGATPGSAWLAGGQVAVDAHLFGILGGLLSGGLLRAGMRRQQDEAG